MDSDLRSMRSTRAVATVETNADEVLGGITHHCLGKKGRSHMSGVANVKRRTFELDSDSNLPAAVRAEDLDVVETSFGKFRRAEVGAQGPSGSDRAFLDVSVARAQLDIDARVGKFEKVEGGARKAGYDCILCDLVFHDSDALLDHLNSRLHQGKLGFSMKIAKSSATEVKSRLAMHLEKAATEAATKREAHGDSLEARLKQAEE